MISRELINEVKNRLVKVYDPLEIYLFGSYAWGHPDDESDLDFLIVVPHSDVKSYKRSIPASYALMDIFAPMDILVYTKDEFDQRLGERSTFCFKVKHKGEKLYARS